MNNFWLHSTKYDGSLHYRYPVEPIQRTVERLVTYSKPGVPVESYRGSWAAKRHILSLFWHARPYVLHVLWGSQWQPESIYIDITTTTSWDDETVRYVDLDLDVILRYGSEAVHLDDQDEFETHRLRWNYPEDLVGRCWAAVEEVRGLLTARKSPFSQELFAWRPGTPLTF
jgi:uncharacterized protein